MANVNRHPSYVTCVADILSESATPLSVDTLVARIAAQRPVGKGARSAVYQAISKLYQAIPVAPGQYGWLPYLLKEQWFRHPLNSVEIRRGFLLLDELEHAVLFPDFFQSHQANGRRVRIDLMGGAVVEAQADIEQGTWSLRLGLPFVEWIDLMGGGPHDDLLIGVKDAVAGEYSMRLQPREARQQEAIQERNGLLVQAAEEIVAGDRKSREAVPVWELAASLIGRGIYAHSVPPDDMHYVLHEHSRLRLLEDMGYTLQSRAQVGRSSGQRRADTGAVGSGVAWADAPPWAESETQWESWEEEFIDEFFADEFALDDVDDEDMAAFFEGADPLFADDDEDAASDHCEGYQAYLAEFQSEHAGAVEPLSHMEFHLLEAELEMLVSLEQEFGGLMPEQEERKLELAERLFIDLNFFYDDGDWDKPDYDDPPFWQN